MSDAQHPVQPVDTETLEALCERLGIEPEFHDYRGERHLATDEVKRRLVQAMGFEIDGRARAREVLERLNLDLWRRGLPPVAVLHADRDKAVEIFVPEALADSPGRWQVRFEQGRSREGEFSVPELERLGEATVEGGRVLHCRLYFPHDLPVGYHQLYLRFARSSHLADRPCQLIVAPAQCYRPPVLEAGGRPWGFSIQLYGLRSKRNWGIGDFTDLNEFMEHAAGAGADFVGLNPLHALFPANPHHISPYSPSSRSFLNYLYLDVTALEDYAECDEARRWAESAPVRKQIERLREADHVDYPAVAGLKMHALQMLYRHFVDRHWRRNTNRARRFAAFVERAGEPLRRQAVYDALFAEHARQGGHPEGWQRWPAARRSPDSAEIKRFVRARADEVRFYEYLQWLCSEQFEAVQRAARVKGMRIGLYRDLAVGVESGGAEAWSEQQSYSFGASVGAPPDPLALKGQDWGLPPLNPHGLQQNRYATFIRLLSANMAHAGALRIDHVMALARLWWVPRGLQATEGAYVHYPFDDLLGILKLESQRNRCLVIGEDLGTVPGAVREKLPAAGVYSYKVMYFEKNGERFKRPGEYTGQAMATVTTHDLPTLAGWWEGVDLEMRDELDLFPTPQIRRNEYESRARDRRALLELLTEGGRLPGSPPKTPEDFPDATPGLASAVHCQLAAGRSALMAVQPEDLLLMRKPVNVPGTTDSYPNWRRKLACTTERLFEKREVRQILARIDKTRRG